MCMICCEIVKYIQHKRWKMPATGWGGGGSYTDWDGVTPNKRISSLMLFDPATKEPQSRSLSSFKANLFCRLTANLFVFSRQISFSFQVRSLSQFKAHLSYLKVDLFLISRKISFSSQGRLLSHLKVDLVLISR